MAYPQAAPFAGAGPHPIVLFVDGRPAYYTPWPPDAWSTTDPAKVQLIGCARTERESEPIAHCSLGARTFPMYPLKYTITVYEATSRAKVATVTVTRSDAPARRAPVSWPSSNATMNW